MIKPVRIALDAMGGDHGPEVIVPGAARALRRRPDMKFLFFGDSARILPLLDAEAFRGLHLASYRRFGPDGRQA
jgi:glycerol-3-phosphate acyltransferase PlsX